MQNSEVAIIQPFKCKDILTGHHVSVKVTPYYSKLIISDRVYYFTKKTREFDRTSCPMRD